MTLDELIDIALEGGREILAVYATEFQSALKPDASFVTQADLACEAVIARRLRAARPDMPVVAEEEMAAGHAPLASPSLFLVDPLDGTRDFVQRNGDFTVNIAIVETGVPVAGVVYAPALGLLWAGSKIEGAFRWQVENGTPRERTAIRVRRQSGTIAAVASRSRDCAATKAWLTRYGEASLLRRGSSLKFCLVADGSVDLYPCLGRTMEWDTAAGDAVLRSAGGLVVTLDNRPLRYDKRRQAHDTDFANPSFVACGDPLLRNRIGA